MPTLWNVVRGEMSLVGPRPDRPEIVAHLEGVIPRYRERIQVRPGIIGFAQVVLAPEFDLDSLRRKALFDYFYVRHYNFYLDLKIILVGVLRYLDVPAKVSLKLSGLPASLEELAVEDAGTKSLQDIIDASSTLRATVELREFENPRLEQAVAALLRASMHFEQIGVHTGLDSLDRALAELENARRSMQIERGTSARKTRRLIEAWDGLLKSERTAMFRQAKAKGRPITNTFITDNPIKEN